MNAYEKRQDAQIGEALRLRREALGFTQAQLGKAIAVTFQQVQKYEQGRNSVRVAKLLMAAEFLKCCQVNRGAPQLASPTKSQATAKAQTSSAAALLA